MVTKPGFLHNSWVLLEGFKRIDVLSELSDTDTFSKINLNFSNWIFKKKNSDYFFFNDLSGMRKIESSFNVFNNRLNFDNLNDYAKLSMALKNQMFFL